MRSTVRLAALPPARALLLVAALLLAGPAVATDLRELVEHERWDEVVPALQSALDASPRAAPADFLDVPSALFESGRAEQALQAAKLLEKRWPRDPDVVGAVGAILAVLERDDEALIRLRAAATMAPGNPVHLWNLARLLAYMGRTEEAATQFSAWSAAETDPQRMVRQSCIYAAFVEKQLGERERACRLQQEFCPETERTACAPVPEGPHPESKP